jgi:hypothetical protein
MFRRRLGKQATLRVDDETFSGRRWLDTLRRWHPEPGAGTVPSPCLTPIRVALTLGEADGRYAPKPSGGFQQSIAGQTVSADPYVRMRP